jgi:PIN domain nuclease of toxin-antitoxin system
MKKAAVCLILMVLVASVSLALSDKYQIYSEKKGWFGLGGRTVMLLDKETGESWLYSDNKWVNIPKVSAEVAALPEAEEDLSAQKEQEKAERTKLEEAINALKAKQEADIKALQEKQNEELKQVLSKSGVSKSNAEEREAKIPVRKMYSRMIKSKALSSANKKPAAKPQEEESAEDAAPAWLRD